jgi:predicted TIM-barrel fold metal-dependent hydrolase
MADFAHVPKVDVHVHANTEDGALLEQAAQDGFSLVSINVDYADFPALAVQAEVAETLAKRDPNRFFFATSFSMKGWDRPDFIAAVIADVDAARRNGAVAVKIWKNVGMESRDRAGRYIMIDDPRFQPLLTKLRRIRMPLIGHQGEPYNAWLPVGQMTTANDRAYFATHPEFHMHLRAEVPGYEAQLEARNRMLARNPRLTFVGAHVGSLEWNIDRLQRFLDDHPNASVDLAARMAQIQHQSVRDPAKVRNFFLRYQDRILYGTDATQNPGADPDDVRRFTHQRWLADWRYLATPQTQHVADIGSDVPGLALPRQAIDKIYRINAQRILLSGNKRPGEQR